MRQSRPKNDPRKQNNTGALVERRSEERRPASGEVTLHLDYGKTVLQAEMVDISPSGFRIRYRGAPLDTSSEVDITYPWGEVRAKIMWIRVVGEWCDVGFLISKCK